MEVEWGAERVQGFPGVRPPWGYRVCIACGRAGVLCQSWGSGQGGKEGRSNWGYSEWALTE